MTMLISFVYDVKCLLCSLIAGCAMARPITTVSSSKIRYDNLVSNISTQHIYTKQHLKLEQLTIDNCQTLKFLYYYSWRSTFNIQHDSHLLCSVCCQAIFLQAITAIVLNQAQNWPLNARTFELIIIGTIIRSDSSQNCYLFGFPLKFVIRENIS